MNSCGRPAVPAATASATTASSAGMGGKEGRTASGWGGGNAAAGCARPWAPSHFLLMDMHL